MRQDDDNNEVVLERHSQADIERYEQQTAASANPFAGPNIDINVVTGAADEGCTLGNDTSNLNTDTCAAAAASGNPYAEYQDPSLVHLHGGDKESDSSSSSSNHPAHDTSTQSSSHPIHAASVHAQPHQSSPPQQYIDNASLLYIPIKLKCGVTAQCQPNVFVHCRDVLADLNTDVSQCLRVLPQSVHSLIKRIQIWVNMNYTYGLIANAKQMKHTMAHHHTGWLVAVARDRPAKAQSIELYSAQEYQRNRLHYNGAGLLLHEYCHLIHQLVLPDGLENIRIQELYHKMKQSGKYANVLRRDWAGLDCERDMHYCTVNFKEMWAELSVTYLADGYPDLAVTEDEDTSGASMMKCSPPFTSPISSFSSSKAKGLVGWVDRLLGRNAALSHCNKFYPFTSRQFATYDPDMFDDIAALWRGIAEWEDEKDSSKAKKCWGVPGVSCIS